MEVDCEKGLSYCHPHYAYPSLGAGGTSDDDSVLLGVVLLVFDEDDFVDELDIPLLLDDDPSLSDDSDSSDGEADGD